MAESRHASVRIGARALSCIEHTSPPDDLDRMIAALVVTGGAAVGSVAIVGTHRALGRRALRSLPTFDAGLLPRLRPITESDHACV